MSNIKIIYFTHLLRIKQSEIRIVIDVFIKLQKLEFEINLNIREFPKPRRTGFQWLLLFSPHDSKDRE